MGVRFPAEWEPQDAVLIAWPHAGTDWADRLEEVTRTYVALALAITTFQRLVIIVADDDLRKQVEACLAAAGIDQRRVQFVEATYDDTWLRDSGPISLCDGAGFQLLDFTFTGWGGKYGAENDDALVTQLFAAGLFSPRAVHRRIEFALEGGGIETDGAGTLLTTWRCLHQRHPTLSRGALDTQLAEALVQKRVLWLDSGYLQGDDTDAHIDTLARFAPGDAIVYQSCDDAGDLHFAELRAMGAELASMRTSSGQAYRLFPLPWAKPVIDEGRRLAASYANYLVINDAVLMPAYGDVADAMAAEVLSLAYPGRKIVQVPCRPLIWQNGSLHCITMQLPAGVLA